MRTLTVALLLSGVALAGEGKPDVPSNGKEQPTSSTQTTPSLPQPVPLPSERTDTEEEDSDGAQGKEEPAEDGEEEEDRGPTTAELLLQIDRDRIDIPLAFTPEVIRWVEWFAYSRTGRATYRRWLSRSTLYKEMMQAELVRAKLPSDLIYLAMIESGFNVYAHSHADAVGPWQFIESTGRNYGLRIDSFVDERRDPLRSTQAAARYLRKLKGDFGNWYMAFASYNAGEGLVFSSIRAYGTIDFWGLSRVGALPAETRDYVPKLIAAAIVGKNPELFGFTNIDYQPPVQWEAVEVKAGTSVADLARAAGQDEDAFRDLNPHLLTDRLPDEPERQTIYLPPDMRRKFYAALSGRPLTPASAGRRVEVPPEAEPDLSHHAKSFGHTVAEGESLSSIAAAYGLSVAELRTLNGLDEEATVTAGQTLKTEASPAGRWTSHTVRRGETLTTIARRYGCTVEQLRGWNGIEEGVTRPDPDTILWLQATK